MIPSHTDHVPPGVSLRSKTRIRSKDFSALSAAAAMAPKNNTISNPVFLVTGVKGQVTGSSGSDNSNGLDFTISHVLGYLMKIYY